MNNADFSNQRSISLFMVEECGPGSTIRLIKNPKTGATFFATDSGLTGRVSKKIDKLSKEHYVSWFNPEDGEPSWMLHTTNHKNELDSMTFA